MHWWWELRGILTEDLRGSETIHQTLQQHSVAMFGGIYCRFPMFLNIQNDIFDIRLKKNAVFHFWLGCYYIASLVYSLSFWDLRFVPALIHGSMDFSDVFLRNKVAFIPCFTEKFEKKKIFIFFKFSTQFLRGISLHS